MDYNALPYIDGDTRTSRSVGTMLQTSGNNPLQISRPFNPPSIGRYPQVSSDLSNSVRNAPNISIYGAQSSYMENTFNNSLGESTEDQSSLPPSYISFLQSRILATPSYRKPSLTNILGAPNSMWGLLGQLRSTGISSSQAPVEVTTNDQIRTLLAGGVSPNYMGDPYRVANQSANIPEHLNTSVWITNLPPDLTVKMLLDNVRGCGKVYATVVNGPEHNHHITAASKLVFFDVAGCENLLNQSLQGRFVVGGYVPRVRRNRIRTAAKPPSPSSRVLHIEGPGCLVNESYLAALYRTANITWQDEEVIVLSSTDRLTRLEWRFGSFRCQAESAWHLIERVKRMPDMPPWLQQLWQRVTVHFGVDPCAT
ncbi:hypothetical protein F5X98DRAFT_384456 [Xylaria grammica]|nr:hypothetical protein F5X98DRAFT_384456 [Xylaria grammica]